MLATRCLLTATAASTLILGSLWAQDQYGPYYDTRTPLVEDPECGDCYQAGIVEDDETDETVPFYVVCPPPHQPASAADRSISTVVVTPCKCTEEPNDLKFQGAEPSDDCNPVLLTFPKYVKCVKQGNQTMTHNLVVPNKCVLEDC